jgi:hydrogenase expression/formation protein HypD
MKYLDEFRDGATAEVLVAAIHKVTTRPWKIMEVCGGQTHSIVRFGIEEQLPAGIDLIHGPGCPVCVTPVDYIDKAIEIAAVRDVIFCTFGDMMKVPGSERDLLSAKSHGGDVRMVYSPLDALKIAGENPDREIVFFAVGFETTAPANAMAVYQARERGITNFSVLVSQVLVPPAIEAILSAPDNEVQAFLAAGHVCTIMGTEEYEPLVQRYRVPIVVTGFEPLDILQGLYMCIRQLENDRAELENQYARAVRANGNRAAQSMIQDVFEVIPRTWRGIGTIAQSGLGLRRAYAEFDAELRFGLVSKGVDDDPRCCSGDVLRGRMKPTACPVFGDACTPDHPLGVTMVSTEGACAAYYKYRNLEQKSA